MVRHAVQTLKFEVAAIPGHVQNGCKCVGVVGGELRVDGAACLQQAVGADQVGEIGIRLAGKDRIIVEATFLSPLNLGIPIRALDQARHHAMAACPCQSAQPVDQGRRPFLVGLHGKSESIPARERRVTADRFKDLQRQLQPFRLLGIDAKTDVMRLGGSRQFQ